VTDDCNYYYIQTVVAWGGITALHKPRMATFDLSHSIGFATVKTTVEISELKMKQTAVQVRSYIRCLNCLKFIISTCLNTYTSTYYDNFVDGMFRSLTPDCMHYFPSKI